VIGRLHLQSHVLDAKPAAQHAHQVVQNFFRRSPVGPNVAAHGIEAAGDAPQMHVVHGFHAWDSAHRGFDLAHVKMAWGRLQ